jgi:hypothetical protein
MFELALQSGSAGARNPPTRDAREARSFKANGPSLRGQPLA